MNKQFKNLVLLGAMLVSSTSFAQLIPANQYHCIGKNIEVNYSASSLTGEPLLNITLKSGQFSAKGDSITVQATVLGNLVSMVKSATPDLSTDYLTVLLPDVNVTTLGAETKFNSSLFITHSRTSIGGPTLVMGAIERNNTRSLACTATAVVF